MSIKKSLFGKLENHNIYLFEIENAQKSVLKITNFGGIITSVIIPDKMGILRDVVLGFNDFQPYIKNAPYFGCIVGRFANRISGGKFNIDSKE